MVHKASEQNSAAAFRDELALNLLVSTTSLATETALSPLLSFLTLSWDDPYIYSPKEVEFFFLLLGA